MSPVWRHRFLIDLACVGGALVVAAGFGNSQSPKLHGSECAPPASDSSGARQSAPPPPDQRAGDDPMKPMAWLGGGLALTLGLAVFLTTLVLGTRWFLAARSEGKYTACKSNLKNIGTALEMYSTDYAGRYPPRLSLLTPTYLKAVPTCPEAGTDTYTPSFQSAALPDAYTFYCSGENHAWAEGSDWTD